ncbi:MAG: hypothetical protein ACK4QL_11765 [Pseudanabaenaceae cyanobacterium]
MARSGCENLPVWGGVDALLLVGYYGNTLKLHGDFHLRCQTIPSESYLEQLPGEVVIFYDRDEAGERGATKLAQRLGDRAKMATVPAPKDYRQGWGISDALNGGFTLDDIHQAAHQAQIMELPTPGELTFSLAMQKVGDILTRYEQVAQQRWYVGALAKQWGRPVGALLEMYQTQHLESLPQPTLDMQDFLQQKQAERQWLMRVFYLWQRPLYWWRMGGGQVLDSKPRWGR